MCIIDMSKDIYISDGEQARDFLRAHGIDDYQHDEFAEYMRFGDVVMDTMDASSMSEYVMDAQGNVYKRIYIVYQDGDEIGALTSLKAMNALISNLTASYGSNSNNIYAGGYLQPIEHDGFFSDALNLTYCYRVEHVSGALKKAIYTSDGWKACNED